MKLAGKSALNFELDYEKAAESDEGDTVGAAVDFYFDRTFSVDVELSDSSDTGFGIRTEKFFTDQFHALARDFTIDDHDTWTIGAAFRF